jgi:UDP-glucose 4-epimerase
MRILVTGGAGFIGSHVTDALLAAGHTVTILDDLSSGSRENVPQGATLVEKSVTENLDEVFMQVQPEAVLHLAAQIDVRKSVENPSWDAQINILGALNLLDAMNKHGCKRIIFSSTGGALYGETDNRPTPENAPALPESPYGIAKLGVEGYLRFYSIVHGFSTCALRYGNVYGPRQALKGEAGVVAVFAKMMLAGKNPTIFGDGEQTRDYVYVGDVAAANLLALEKELTGTFNVGTGVETSVNTLAQALAHELGWNEPVAHGAAIAGELRNSSLDASALKAHGWRVTKNIDAGIRETAAWFRENKERL